MDWIKKNPEKFALLVVTVILLGCSAVLILDALAFKEVFNGIQGNVNRNGTIQKIDTSALQHTQESLLQPAAWVPHEGSLFVSRRYILLQGKPFELRATGGMLNPPIPDEWLNKYGLDPLQSGVLEDDPDGDGFTNLDEWRNLKGDGTDATNPSDKNSHPDYYTKLRLKRFIRKQFRLIFNAFDGDLSKPDTLTFQINTVDVKQPSLFLKMGDPITGTKFKITKFEHKTAVNQNQVEVDISELTLQNQETGLDLVLVLGKLGDSPDSYALFKYLWNGDEFQVKKGQSFILKPEVEKQYKLVDINDNEALVETPAGEKIKIPHLEK